jgi:long-chain acyl-CoA synthetase
MGLESSPRPGRTAARLARQVELALSEVDLSLSQYRILIYLDEGKVQASALADKLSVTRPSVTAVVDGLVTKGLVERHHDPGDRRRVGHDLTAEGRRVLKKCDESVDRRLSDIASMIVEVRTSASKASRSEVDDFSNLECWRNALDEYRNVRLEQKVASKVAAKLEQKLTAKLDQKVVAE